VTRRCVFTANDMKKMVDDPIEAVLREVEEEARMKALCERQAASCTHPTIGRFHSYGPHETLYFCDECGVTVPVPVE
jgi:hypothetical protein